MNEKEYYGEPMPQWLLQIVYLLKYICSPTKANAWLKEQRKYETLWNEKINNAPVS